MKIRKDELFAKIKQNKALEEIWALLQDAYERELCVEGTERLEVKKGDFVYREGDKTDYLYLLEKGQLRHYREGVSGHLHITRLIRPGQIFGLRSFLTCECQASSVEAYSKAYIYRIKSSVFRELIDKNNKFCQYLLRLVVNEMNIAEERTIFLTQKYTRGRLADALLMLVRYYGFEEDGKTIDIRLTRQELAELANMTSGNAIRTLSSFSKERVVELGWKQVRILNLKGLEDISRMG